jgi:hypothetical protein
MTITPFQGLNHNNLHGTESINWSLSNVEGSVSNPPTSLGPGATSNLLSSTLAPNGDFLLFENTSGVAIEIELTVVEA